ncbi:MAG: M1 family metallopeptidase [Thermoanaerobaculia bacterium]
MRQIAFAAAATFVLGLPATALEAPRKIVDYDIRVSLDPATKLVEGSETLKWTNPGDGPVGELRFHLYWNAFRNDRSTFFRESGGQLGGVSADTGKGWGYTDVTSMTWDGAELMKSARFESPDDGNPDDRTVLVVPLPRAVAPGETATLAIAWKAKVPRVFVRAGYVRDFYMFGQWFPQIGVYEPRGRRRRTESGWNCHQYHAMSEFYADWGDWRVAITLPEKFVVGSAGALVDTKAAGGSKTLTFEQKAVHNFAFTADPRYVVIEDFFDPAKDIPKAEIARASKTLGRSEADLLAGFHKVAIRLYLQPDHRAFDRRHIEAQKWALAWTGLWAFPYPYAQISIVDTPEDGLGATGMEYETIYTTFSWQLLSRWPLDRVYYPEAATIHEFTHGYWMGLLASNEFEESWMDEGINTFTESVMVDRKYGGLLQVPPGIGFTDEEWNRAYAALTQDHDPILSPSWKYATEGSYARNSYAQPGTAIEQIRLLLGEEAFWRAFRSYAERWRFDHPTSEDFLDAMAGAGNPHVTGLIPKVWYGRGWVDFSILEATTRPDDGFTGFDDAEKPVNFDPDLKKKQRERLDERKHKGPWQSLVVVGRDGDIEMPVHVVLTFKGGQKIERTWNGASGWIKYHATTSEPLVKAEVDPERRIVLDRNPWNNARYTKEYEGPSAAAKGRTYALHLVEILLSTLWGVL